MPAWRSISPTPPFAADFEPALSHRLTLDHGFCIPLWRAGLDPPPPIVPLLVNEIEPPMLSVRRCLEWGRLLAKAIATYPEHLRVAILASGGLSHSIGEPTMGAIDEEFDAESIRLFDKGAEQPMIDYFEAKLPTVGNGGHEVRSWFIAHAAAGSRGFELLEYLPVPEVYVGCGFASWRVCNKNLNRQGAKTPRCAAVTSERDPAISVRRPDRLLETLAGQARRLFDLGDLVSWCPGGSNFS